MKIARHDNFITAGRDTIFVAALHDQIETTLFWHQGPNPCQMIYTTQSFLLTTQ